MSRNGSGVYTPPPSYNPVLAGTTIDPVAFNATINDMATALTGSLPVDGQAPMTGPFRLAAGTSSNPSFGFGPEPSTGLYWPGTGSMGFSVGAAERMRLLSNGNLIIGSVSDAGQKFQVNGSALITGASTLNGVATFNSTTANPTVGVIIQNTSSNGAVLQLQGNGATTPNKIIRVYNGNLEIVNSANSSAVVSITDTGAIGATSFSGNLVGGTLTATTGNFTGSVQSGSGANGTATLTPGNATNTGYIQFSNASAVRQAYIGFTATNAALNFNSDNGAGFNFSHQVTATTFNGAGTGLTGTASGLNIGGNSATTSQTSWSSLSTTTQLNAQGSQGNSSIAGAAASAGAIMVQGNGTGAAFMSFHRPSSFAAYFGLDTDNQWKVGGWSMGAVAYNLYHSGNINITSAAGTASRVVQADASGYISNTYFNSSDNSASSGITALMCKVSDNYLRSGTAAAVAAFISGQSFNVNGNAATITHNYGRTDGSSYPVVWMPGANNQPAYSCAAVTITSSTGTLNASALYATGDITAYSDARIKTDVVAIPDALAKIDKIRGVTFTRIDEGHAGVRQAGVIAQEVEAVLPEVVKTNEEGMKSVNYGALVSLLIESIKDLSAKVKALEAR